jgi:hypothetical protein
VTPHARTISSRKRGRQFGLDAAQVGVIKLLRGSIAAELLAVRACSSCARGIPTSAQEWDLSGLQIDGQPADLELVTAWLGCVDSLLRHAAADNTDSSAVLNTGGIAQLLCFADAAGSVEGVLHAGLSKLRDLQYPVALIRGGGDHGVAD